VVGVDEAGRGCLAGPVAAAAVLLPEVPDISALLPGLADSKQLSARQRLVLERAIRRCALSWSLGLAWPAEIDEVNILNATFRAMSRAVSTLPRPPDAFRLLIDGNLPIREDAWRRVSDAVLPPQQAMVHGDALVPAVSAASILAKTFRDRLMEALDKRHPGYGFAVHKGYPTRQHREALLRLAPCPMHRRSFRCEERREIAGPPGSGGTCTAEKIATDEISGKDKEQAMRQQGPSGRDTGLPGLKAGVSNHKGRKKERLP
jgi:ribonuclease HII